MSNHQLKIIIDFDSTFIKLEALDELANLALSNNPEKVQILQQIKALTEQSMNGDLSISDSLNQRIKLINANYSDVTHLANLLKDQVSNSFKNNKQFLDAYKQHIYIVSNGFKEFILPIVTEYGILPAHIFANQFIFDEEKNIIGIDESNVLTKELGKVACVKSLNLTGEVVVLGDGYTDYQIKQHGAANKFYAFTENIARDKVTSVADYIIPNFDEFLYLNHLPMVVSYPKHRIKILLLENVHLVTVELLRKEGYTVETYIGAMNEDELCQKIKGVSILGIRSKTQVTAKVLAAADKLMAIGAFCIGTNQIDISASTQKGVCVFNAPYSNTRSVVELALGEMIMLLRKAVSKNNKLHNGIWDKSADNCFEIRGKKLGIIGYGNIGSQLSVLAENLGMQVYYYDVAEKLALGNAKKCTTLNELLQLSDIISVHVDGRKDNQYLIGENELALMQRNSIFINLSRGHVVDIEALVKYINQNKFLGVAIDVYPSEPTANHEEFLSQLRGLDNVILTPHIGGSTQEAQYSIGEFVAQRIINYINLGDTMQSVNLPNIQLPGLHNAHRLIHLHSNVPGVLAALNQIFARHSINILWQSLRTNENIGYMIIDIDKTFDNELTAELREVAHTIKFRVLY
jgi:D-3-phosphoglycerate dehydrogenase